MSQAYSGAIMRMETFRLNDVGARNTESGMAGCGGQLRRLRILLHSGGRRKKPNGAVSQHAVNVKQDELYFFGPGFGHGCDEITSELEEILSSSKYYLGTL